MAQFYVNNIPGADPPQDAALPKENTQKRFNFAVGALVHTRGRDWKVLPGSTDKLLRIHPVYGSPIEETAVLAGIDYVEQAVFSPPDPEGEIGNFRLGRNLRDAYRFRVSDCTGPFRSFGRINCTPRLYQLVPLIMALRQKTVRLLIADDVGIGKTIEAGLIIRELFDRGEIQRFSIVCPPHLAPQWKKELFDKFRLEAELVLPSTVARLDRELIFSGKSIFQEYNTIVSIDYIKNEGRRQAFLKDAPELIVIDEAHLLSVTSANEKHLRHQFAERLCGDSDRNILLLTATPHSGKSDAFRSLLALLRSDFAKLPKNLSSKKREKYRKQIAPYFVERVRDDIVHTLDEETHFPARKDEALRWNLTPEYRVLFEDIISFAKELVGNTPGEKRHQRLRLWSALALFLSLASSPEAAESTLRSRVMPGDIPPEEEEEEADRIGLKNILGIDFENEDSANDLSVGCRFEDDPEKNELLDQMAKAAGNLKGEEKDPKLAVLIKTVKKLIREGFSPIVFCHYISTAKYLGEQLGKKLPSTVALATVTSRIPSEDRERRIDEICQREKRVLICTDCLSEGINLQESFNAVIHYDLCWNPTRYAQREGRIDRFGQEAPEVRCLTIYGEDNWIDKYILKNNEEKLKKIKQDTGVEIAASSDNEIGRFFDLISHELSLFSNTFGDDQGTLDFGEFDEDFDDSEDIDDDQEIQDNSEVKPSRGRTIFAQRPLDTLVKSLKPEIADSVGSMDDLRQFVLGMLAHGGCYKGKFGSAGEDQKTEDSEEKKNDISKKSYEVDFTGCDRELRSYIPERLLQEETARLRFDPIHAVDEESICRTHPLVEGLAEYAMDCALGGAGDSPARRCGAVCTDLVREITTVLLLRCRYQITQTKSSKSSEQLAEEVRFIGFTGRPDDPRWLCEDDIQKLLAISRPSGNISPQAAASKLKQILDAKDSLTEPINTLMSGWAQKIQQSQQRVRSAETPRGGVAVTCKVQPILPPDWLGVYRFIPPTKTN